MIIWEQKSEKTRKHSDLINDKNFGLEILVAEETNTQITFRINLYSNTIEYKTIEWGFGWNVIVKSESDFIKNIIKRSDRRSNRLEFLSMDYYNRIDNVLINKDVDKEIYLVDTTSVTLEKYQDDKIHVFQILNPTCYISDNYGGFRRIFDSYDAFGIKRNTNTIKIYLNKGVGYNTGLVAKEYSLHNNTIDPEYAITYFKPVGTAKTICPTLDGFKTPMVLTGIDIDGDGIIDNSGPIQIGSGKTIETNYEGVLYGYNTKQDGTGEEYGPEFTYKRNEDIELYPDIRPQLNQLYHSDKSFVFYLNINYEPDELFVGDSRLASIGILKKRKTPFDNEYYLAKGGLTKDKTRHVSLWADYDFYAWSILSNIDKMYGLHPRKKHFKEWNTKSDGTGITITNENIVSFLRAWDRNYYYTCRTDGNSYYTYRDDKRLIDVIAEVNNNPDEYIGEYISTSDGYFLSATKENINYVANNRSPFETVEIYTYHSARTLFSGYVLRNDWEREPSYYLNQKGELEQIDLATLTEFIAPLWDDDNGWYNNYFYYEPGIDIRNLHPSHIYYHFYADPTWLYTQQEVVCRLYAIWEPDESTVTLDNHLVLEDKDYTVTEKADYNGKTVISLGDAYNYYTTVAGGRYALNKNFGYKITDTRYTGMVEFVPFSKWEDKDFDLFDGAAADYEITLYRQYIKQTKPAVTFGEAASFTKAYDELFNISLSDEELINIVGPGATVKYWQDQYGNKYGVGTPNNFYIPAEENRHLTLTPMVVGKNYSVTLKSSLGETRANCFYGTFTFGIQNLDPYKDEANKKAAEKLVNDYNNVLNKKIKGWKVNNNDLIYDLTLALASNTDYTNPINLNLVFTEKTKNIMEFYDGDEHKFDLAVYSDDTYDEWRVGNFFNVKRFYKNGYVFDGVTLDGVKFIDKNFKIIADTVLFDINGKSHVEEDDTIETYRVQIQWKWAPGVVIEKKNYTCHICIDGEFKEMLPYVYHNGRWQIATYDWRGV